MKPTLSLTSLLLAMLVISSFANTAFGDEWKPIDPADLALKSPLVEKDADAEALFWEVKIDDNPEGDLIFNHYIRIKIFTDRGRESQSKIDIPFGNFFGHEIKIKDIAARTIKSDGSIVELKNADVFERTIVKLSGAKVKAKSFAIPAIEAGAIIEYRWKEVRVRTSANYVRLDFQRDIPVERVSYLIKPYPFEGLGFRSITLHGHPTPFVKEKQGFFSTTMTNVPAIHEESRMPPENQMKTWMLVYYAPDEQMIPEKYWMDLGKRMYEEFKPRLKPNDEIRQAATAAIGDAKTDDEKISRLFDFCRTKIRNTSDDASGLTAEERKKLKENKSASDTLKRGTGDGGDIDMLFATMATAAGFDARVVMEGDRGDLFFEKGIPNSYFLDPSNIAIKVGDTWKFYNPGYNYIPIGMLRWQEEGEPALITDPKEPVWVNTPLSEPSKSHVQRTAKLKLADDGTLEGDIHVEFTGHFAIEKKEENDDDSANQREETLKDEIKSRMSTAEVSDIHVDNVTDPVKPFMYTYHVRIPGYAQRTGKRLFLQPAVFQHGAPTLFSASDRRYPIYFHYPWSEKDEVQIELPAGYALENPESPAGFASLPISEYRPSLGVSNDGKFLVYKRQFYFGGGGTILFPAESYSQLKNFFDTLYQRDNHTITLKQATAAQ